MPKLLLPPARGVTIHHSRRERYIYRTAIVVGLAVLLAGAADISSRLASVALGDDALFDAFAPAAALHLQNSKAR